MDSYPSATAEATYLKTRTSFLAICQQGSRRIASSEADVWGRGGRRHNQHHNSGSEDACERKEAVRGRTRRVVTGHLAERARTLAVSGRPVAAGAIGDAKRPLEVRNVRVVVKTRQPEELNLSEEGRRRQKAAPVGRVAT